MQSAPITAELLFNTFQTKLHWHWAAGKNAAQHRFDDSVLAVADSGTDLVGYLNAIHSKRIQVLGTHELAYLQSNSVHIQQLVNLQAPMLVVADGQTPSADMLQTVERAGIPLLTTQKSASLVIDTLRAYLSRQLAQQTSMHGVFMDILGLGVLITGDSGIGKSELGLELISRGNGLVADDVVDLLRVNQNRIEGTCPQLLQNLLEVRGIGLLDIRTIFGETAVRRHMRLRLIVHLVLKHTVDADYERLPIEPMYQDVLGIPIRKVIIEVVAGRNLAVLVEAAVRNCILQLRGIDTYVDFTQRQRAVMLDVNSKF